MELRHRARESDHNAERRGGAVGHDVCPMGGRRHLRIVQPGEGPTGGVADPRCEDCPQLRRVRAELEEQQRRLATLSLAVRRGLTHVAIALTEASD